MTSAAFMMATLQPTLVPAAPLPAADLLAKLWRSRRAVIAESKRLADEVDRIEAELLPSWAATGCARIDSNGNYYGDWDCPWPERADIDEMPLPGRGAYRRVRMSPREVWEGYRQSSRFHKGSDLALVKAKSRAAMRKLIARIREQREVRERIGLTAAEKQQQRLMAQFFEIEASIRDLPASSSKAAALCLMHLGSEMQGIFDTVGDAQDDYKMFLAFGVLAALRPELTGQIASDVDALIGAPSESYLLDFDFIHC